MKKGILLSIVFILIVSLCTFVNAYSTSNYSFDVPSTWKELGGAGIFRDSSGNSVNVQVSKFTGDAGNPYTEEMLNEIVDEIKNDDDSSFKCKSIDTKEITTCTKNNYKCFHIIANYEMSYADYYCNQYGIVSGNEFYVITLSAEEKEEFESSEMKNIVDSFTIKNYQEPKSGPSILTWTLIGAGVGAVIGGLTYFLGRNKNNSSLNG